MPRKDLDRRMPLEVWRIVAEAERLGRELSAEDRSDRRPASPRGELPALFMLDMIALFFGIIALMLMLSASIPFIATADWLIVPIAATGLALGLLSGSAAGRNLNLLVLLIRLIFFTAGG